MVYVLLATGFEEIEALAFVDILRRAGIDTKTVSVDGNATVTGSHGIEVVADIKIDDVDSDVVDAVVLPGGLPGAYNLRDSEKVRGLLCHANERNITIGAICASPCVVLYSLKLLDGKRATVYPGYESEMPDANIISENVVCDGNIITSKGAGTTHEFAKEFVARFKDEDTASKLIAEMQYK